MTQLLKKIIKKTPFYAPLRNLRSRGESNLDALDVYVLKYPEDQNILDVFKGEWSSEVPNNLITKPGKAKLFDDARVNWAEDSLGSFAGRNILELGPLEGGHSFMFQEKKAKKVTAIEANSRAFLKCLCVKEIYKLNNIEFKLGDFMAFLRKDHSKYDMVSASGVLYHMEDPVELIKLISKVTDRVHFWTQYYDKEIVMNNPGLSFKFQPMSTINYDGESYEYSTQSYKDSLGWSGFCGGPQPVSKWLTRGSIIKALKKYGFVDITIGFDTPEHPNGPAFAICATKKTTSL